MSVRFGVLSSEQSAQRRKLRLMPPEWMPRNRRSCARRLRNVAKGIWPCSEREGLLRRSSSRVMMTKGLMAMAKGLTLTLTKGLTLSVPLPSARWLARGRIGRWSRIVLPFAAQHAAEQLAAERFACARLLPGSGQRGAHILVDHRRVGQVGADEVPDRRDADFFNW